MRQIVLWVEEGESPAHKINCGAGYEEGEDS